MLKFLWAMRPYFRQVAGELLLGSLAGILMNTAVVLPAIMLGRAIDTALAYSRGEAGSDTLLWAALAFIGGTLATELPRIFKRWFLITANGRIRANLRADLLRGVLAWPMARVHATPIGDTMARIIGDVETLSLGVRYELNTPTRTYTGLATELDTDLNTKFPAKPVVTRCVKDYRLEVFDGKTWKEVAREKDNFLRQRVHRFKTQPVSKVRLTVDATNGDPSARVFEVRAFEVRAFQVRVFQGSMSQEGPLEVRAGHVGAGQSALLPARSQP